MSETALASPLEQYATVTETALILHAGTPMAAWEEIGRSLGRLTRSSKWLLADWLVQGEALYGEHYAQGMDATGLSYQTLMNLATVGRRVPPEVRRGDLSHAHHAEVTKFETAAEQAAWLQRAIEHKWTVKELREQIRGPEPMAKQSDADRIAAVVAEQVTAWWSEMENNGQTYATLLAGTTDDRVPLFNMLAQRVAGALVALGAKVRAR